MSDNDLEDHRLAANGARLMSDAIDSMEAAVETKPRSPSTQPAR